MPGTAYHAFVSYSHSADATLAPALRLALHKFAKPWYKPRAVSVFLDQSSLSANPALWTAIERALSSAKNFILLASPESAASPWVLKEIDWWLAHRSVDSMLILLTGGELAWNPTAGDFDWTRTTSISPELAGGFPAEPLYVDLRSIKAEGTLSLRDPKFRAAVLDVAAPLHGRNKDELDGEDIRQNRRTMRIARGVTVAMALLAAAAVWQAIVANQQRNEAIAQRGVAERETARAVEQEGIANRQTIEARHQKTIADRERDEAVRQRDLALSRRLVSDSSRQLLNPLQWDLAMLLAIESMRKAPTSDSYELLARLSSDGARIVAAFPGENLVAFSPDSRLVATGDRGHLVVRDAHNGRERARVDADSIALRDICFTPAAGRVVGHSDEEAIAIDIAGRRRVPLPVEIERGGRVSVSTDCRFLTTARAGTARLIALETNRVVTEFPVPAALTTLATSPDGDGVAYTEGSRVTIVSARSKAVRGQWQAGQDVVRTAFDADGKRLMVSIGTRGTVILDAGDGRTISESAARGSLSPGGELAADLEREGRELVTWDVGRGVWTKRVPLSRSATNLAWSNDGEFLVYGGGEGDGSARVLQSESWRQLARFAFPSGASSNTPGATPPQVHVRISPSGNLASAANSRNGVVFEIHRDRPIVILPSTVKPGPVALSANGRRVAFRTMNRTISIVDTGSLRERASFQCGGSSSQRMQLSGNGRILVSSCPGGAHVVYDLEGGRPVLTGRQSSSSRIVMSRDGAVVLAGTGVFRTATGTKMREITGGSLAALDSQGTRIAVAGHSLIELFDLRTTGAPRSLEAAIDLLESLAFSDDGALLAAGGRDMRVKIFNSSTGELVRVLEHIEQDQWVFKIHRLVFSPRGTLIATMAEDPTETGLGRPGTVRVFEVGTGREVARFPFPEIAHEVRFAADDSALEIAVGRRRLRWERYPLSPAGMIARACTLVQRQMAPIDWARFMGDEPRRETCPAVPH